jgi:hypothetical protein
VEETTTRRNCVSAGSGWSRRVRREYPSDWPAMRAVASRLIHAVEADLVTVCSDVQGGVGALVWQAAGPQGMSESFDSPAI